MYNKDHEIFWQYKNRKFLFIQNEWPVIMGVSPGLHQIRHPKALCEKDQSCHNCISNTAYQYLYVPFIQNSALIWPNNNHSMYMFNWSGDLSKPGRLFAGKILADEIEKIYHEDPDACIQLYAHSHGGNVALYAATLLQKRRLKINSIVLLGTPIGEKTKKWVSESTNITLLINCYIKKDWIQIIDIFFNKWICEQKFPAFHYVKNVQLVPLNKKKSFNHSLLFYFLFENDPPAILPYLPQLIDYVKNKKKTCITYKIYT